MAETENATEPNEFETRLAALEKSIRELRQMVSSRTGKIAEIHADAVTSRENSVRVLELLEEVLPLVRRAAPLLDSPLAKMATSSPAASVLGLFGGGRRG